MTYQENAERPKELGALWIKTSKKGVQYMSGMIEIEGVKHAIVCFANKKSKDTQPDYKIMPNQPLRNSQQENQQALNNEGASENIEDVKVEDIPF